MHCLFERGGATLRNLLGSILVHCAEHESDSAQLLIQHSLIFLRVLTSFCVAYDRCI